MPFDPVPAPTTHDDPVTFNTADVFPRRPMSSDDMRTLVQGHALKTQTQTQIAHPPLLPPPFEALTTATKGKRFFWVRMAVRGPWIAAQAAYTDPNNGVFLPGTAGIQTPAAVGPEIFPPGSYAQPVLN